MKMAHRRILENLMLFTFYHGKNKIVEAHSHHIEKSFSLIKMDRASVDVKRSEHKKRIQQKKNCRKQK